MVMVGEINAQVGMLAGVDSPTRLMFTNSI